MWASDEKLQRWAHFWTIIQSVAVVVALVVTAWQVFVETQEQQEQEYEAINDIISMGTEPESVSDAFYNLYQDRETLLKADRKDFEGRIGALHSYFWLVDSCIHMEICDSDEALSKFCGDFGSYRGALRSKYAYSDGELSDKLRELGLATLHARCLENVRGALGDSASGKFN